ncbi:MAG: hypothetical protein C3F07_08435 [Anaerolineales bacterium]|nr:hypothetical protein [Anaerolineae bacterium]PWB74050.1 MAG: hypothetical protein C3F07_08435 [Anaerolineales bacterium]
MNAWTKSQLVVFGIGLLLAFAGEKLSMPILTYGGISLFGIAAFLIGMEAAITRRIVLGRRRYDETYLGIAAYAQGVQFMIVGVFLIGISFLAYFDTGRDLFLHFVRRPGTVSLTLGIYCLMQAVIAIAGYEEQKQGTRWIVLLNFFTSRLLPGVILIVIGLGFAGLGLFEIVAPAAFDNLGGGFLEVLYGLK